MDNILVAIDSFESTTITSPLMQKTIELAKAFSSKVWILHVAPKLREAPFNIDKKVLRDEVAHELHEEHELLHQLARSLRDQNIDATSLLIEGSTINSILHKSEQLDIDLIILGCHRHSELFGAIMNDTGEGLIAKCSLPIMFIPTLEQ